MSEPYYERGGVTLYLGDCREILPGLSRGAFAAIVMDPPYGIAYESGWESPWGGTQVANDADTSARDWVLAWAIGLPVACFGSWRANRPSGTRQRLVWDKGAASGMGDLSFPWKPSDEEVYIIGAGWSGRRDESVLKGFSQASSVTQGRVHPNEKPVALLGHFVGKAPPGRILDPFAGSGPTLRACIDAGREATGIEVDERWCEVAARRCDAAFDGVRPAERKAGQSSLFSDEARSA